MSFRYNDKSRRKCLEDIKSQATLDPRATDNEEPYNRITMNRLTYIFLLSPISTNHQGWYNCKNTKGNKYINAFTQKQYLLILDDKNRPN